MNIHIYKISICIALSVGLPHSGMAEYKAAKESGDRSIERIVPRHLNQLASTHSFAPIFEENEVLKRLDMMHELGGADKFRHVKPIPKTVDALALASLINASLDESDDGNLAKKKKKGRSMNMRHVRLDRASDDKDIEDYVDVVEDAGGEEAIPMDEAEEDAEMTNAPKHQSKPHSLRRRRKHMTDVSDEDIAESLEETLAEASDAEKLSLWENIKTLKDIITIDKALSYFGYPSETGE